MTEERERVEAINEDLLAALKKLVRVIEPFEKALCAGFDNGRMPAMDKGRAAIAKAEGDER